MLWGTPGWPCILHQTQPPQHPWQTSPESIATHSGHAAAAQFQEPDRHINNFAASAAAAPAAPAAAVSMHAPSGQHQALLWPLGSESLATLECPPQGLCPRFWLSQLITSSAGAPGGEHLGLHRGNCAQGWGYPGDPRVLPHLPPRGGFRVVHTRHTSISICRLASCHDFMINSPNLSGLRFRL